MDSPSIDPVTCRQDTEGKHRPEGLSLLEMMLVVTLILIVGGAYVRVLGKACLIL
jgi:prepilin-type N-terminal cleavage/methylation domain-containing protein